MTGAAAAPLLPPPGLMNMQSLLHTLSPPADNNFGNMSYNNNTNMPGQYTSYNENYTPGQHASTPYHHHHHAPGQITSHITIEEDNTVVLVLSAFNNFEVMWENNKLVITLRDTTLWWQQLCLALYTSSQHFLRGKQLVCYEKALLLAGHVGKRMIGKVSTLIYSEDEVDKDSKNSDTEGESEDEDEDEEVDKEVDKTQDSGSNLGPDDGENITCTNISLLALQPENPV
ncbi:hypothetical protein SERLADRAFT_409448 [Serpula lacrymans var. lacrymans S7.9]|nr:uncharacterized protein SERLADRAFT_409448 [Serpula lacrymans var. lacrymans S7.9]EGO22931.1 hypothetical protein SERLADRAFT_409448 [Serpula lacrymans var. lacrymans S7.9]